MPRIIVKLLFLSLLFLVPALTRATPPLGGEGGTPLPTPLNSWSFGDTESWQSDNGYPPISFTNLASSFMGSLDARSLKLDHTNAAWLRFKVVESDGATNLTVNFGTVSLWFAPNWSSANTNRNGQGPGVWGRLIETGAYTEDADYGWWSLLVDEYGTNLLFCTQTNSGDSAVHTYLTATIDWKSNRWQNIVLTYSLTNSALYLNGQLAVTGNVVSVFPGPDVLANGFWIGSDSNGVAQARGYFEDVKTYRVPLTADEITFLYSRDRGFLGINPANRWDSLAGAPSTPSYFPVFRAVTGSGFLTADATNGITCLTHSNIWFTNVVAFMESDDSMTIRFEIAGGTNDVLYDVFENHELPATSELPAWRWVGQGYHCVTYSLRDLQNDSSFLILGTPQDSDFDGLTDAYENLVSKTLKDNEDTDGDGWTDGEEIVNGTDPLTPDEPFKVRILRPSSPSIIP